MNLRVACINDAKLIAIELQLHMCLNLRAILVNICAWKVKLLHHIHYTVYSIQLIHEKFKSIDCVHFGSIHFDVFIKTTGINFIKHLQGRLSHHA